MKKLMIMIAIVIGFSATAQAKEINLGCETERVEGKKTNFDLYLNTEKMTGTKSDEDYRGQLAVESGAYVLVISVPNSSGELDIRRVEINRADLSVIESLKMELAGMMISKTYKGSCVIKEAPKNQI